jgi:hypothetical protein
MHKLSPPWERPFAISRALGNDAYYLIDARKDDNGEPLTREVECPGTSTYSGDYTPSRHVCES